MNYEKTIIRIFILSLSVLAYNAEATLIWPTAYLSFTDSPFNGTSFSYFYLEDFEDALLNTPGVSAVRGSDPGVAVPGSNTDSVHGDDKAIDGFGRNGRSFSSTINEGFGNTGFTFTFNASVLCGFARQIFGRYRSDNQNLVLTPAPILRCKQLRRTSRSLVLP